MISLPLRKRVCTNLFWYIRSSKMLKILMISTWFLFYKLLITVITFCFSWGKKEKSVQNCTVKIPPVALCCMSFPLSLSISCLLFSCPVLIKAQKAPQKILKKQNKKNLHCENGGYPTNGMRLWLSMVENQFKGPNQCYYMPLIVFCQHQPHISDWHIWELKLWHSPAPCMWKTNQTCHWL